ncbi:family 1 glycosylhydrolase [Candidatus Poribacteria bacterium]|nr:family 1 glycosylhydrolase [Candidatus Poribacteria bacterium]
MISEQGNSVKKNSGHFEWRFGYRRRLGIVRVDFGTQKRTMKRSGHRYSQTVKNNGFSDELVYSLRLKAHISWFMIMGEETASHRLRTVDRKL